MGQAGVEGGQGVVAMATAGVYDAAGAAGRGQGGPAGAGGGALLVGAEGSVGFGVLAGAGQRGGVGLPEGQPARVPGAGQQAGSATVSAAAARMAGRSSRATAIAVRASASMMAPRPGVRPPPIGVVGGGTPVAAAGRDVYRGQVRPAEQPALVEVVEQR